MGHVYWDPGRGEWISDEVDRDACVNAAKSQIPDVAVLARIVGDLLGRVCELERRIERDDDYRREQNERG